MTINQINSATSLLFYNVKRKKKGVNPMASPVSGCVSRSRTLPRPSRRVAPRRVAQEPGKNGTYYANRQRKRSTDKERDTGEEGGRTVVG
ncbi:hypothetical protein PUN28_010637 [Cardiocondyla obscurior]|uniref:Uncharacterized protein n=1 Tax=Cardiocondyla obscurior TaxID=286306 RepID=A0AAW2FJB0_9HYME